MAAPESPEAALESLVGQIADEFTRRLRRGERPTTAEYADRYPELAELLAEILPAVQALNPAGGAALAETPATRDTRADRAVIPPAPRLADYEVLGEIGHGGMGVVYKARHRALGRVVALKVLRSHDAADLERFRTEAQAVAGLQHPHVVQLFEVGEADGRPFLALEYVPGGSLADRIRGEPQPPREAAALVRTLARAMATAHAAGLVHRDLKPSNILLQTSEDRGQKSEGPTDLRPLTSDLCPKITDFGLAKRFDLDLRQTQTGAVVGTPTYMAPEQAAGTGRVVPAADIYSLGTILYELIAGRPPFKGPSVLETLELVRTAEPTPPSQLQPGCPRDLETICLKCLHKDPGRRYESAGDLADDLDRFLNREPIRARPVGAVERLGKWLRRRPALAASVGLGAVAAVALVGLAVRLAYSWELEDANARLGEAVGAREQALLVAQEARGVAERNHEEADDARAKLDAALDRERALHYVHSIGLAHREWQANRVDEARRLLDACPADLRHWEWHYLYRQCHAEEVTIRCPAAPVIALAVSPTGTLVAAATGARAEGVVAWDLKVWDAATGKPVWDLAGHEAPITDVAFSPDGALLASTSYDKTIRLWDTWTGREVRKITSTTSSRRVVFSPDGTRLAALPASQVRLLEVATGAELFTLSGHAGAGLAVAFSPDGKRLASAGLDMVVKVWDLTARRELFSCRGHTGEILDVAFSPKQSRILSCGPAKFGTAGGEVRVWDAEDGKPVPLVLTFPAPITAAGYSPDGSSIACAARDGTVHILDAPTSRPRFVLRGHGGEVPRLGFTTDGRRLVTGSADRTIRVWPVRNPEFAELPDQLPRVVVMGSSPSGDRVVLAAVGPSPAAPRLRVVPVPPTGGPPEVRPANPQLALGLAPDGSWLAGADRLAVRFWDVGQMFERRVIGEPGVVDLSASPDGRYLATAQAAPDARRRPDLAMNSGPAGAKDGSRAQSLKTGPAIRVWRVADGQLVRTFSGHQCVSFGPDGRLLAGARHASVVVWDAVTGAEVCKLTGPTDEPVLKVQIVAGSRRVVGFTTGQAIVWDVETTRVIATVDGLNGPACATPDGRRVVGLHDGSLRWWDVPLGRELLFLAAPKRALVNLTLSADGRSVAAAGPDGLVFWRAGPP